MRYDKEKTIRNIDGVKTSNTRTKECALAIASAIKDGSELDIATKNYIETLFDGLRLRGGFSAKEKRLGKEWFIAFSIKKWMKEDVFYALNIQAQALKEASNLICRLIFF